MFENTRVDINELKRQHRTDLRLFQRCGIGWNGNQGVLVDPNEFIFIDEDFNNFECDDTTNRPTGWVHVADAGATGATGPATSEVGSWCQIHADGDDNDEAYMRTRAAPFKMLTNRILVFGARLKLVNNATAGKNTGVAGLMDITVGGAANTIVDGGTLATTFDGFAAIKPEDGANWRGVSSNAATQDTDDLTAFTSGTAAWVEVLYDYNNGVTGKLHWFVNGVWVVTQDITISGLDATLALVFGTKMHETGTEGQFLCDRIYCYQPK